MLYFDIQRFATGTAIKISGVIKNVEVGDTFTVDDAKYTILTVEEKSVTAIVEGTPTTDFGKEIVISDNKSIEGATIETSETSDVDSKISTKYTYKLDIGGNSVFVIIYENAIESVKDSDGNPLSASGDNYTVGTINFALSLDNGIPNATYNGTSSVAAVLDTTTYSFSVDSKPVEVVVQNDAITKVSVDSAQVGTAAGTYSVGTQQLKLSYANGSLTAQNASSVSPTISSVATYIVGDTTVTVDSSGQLSQTTATVNGQTATLTYSAETKKITASYTVSTAGDSDTYTVTLPDKSTVTVKVESGAISSVTYNNKEITATEGKYSVTTTGGTNYTLSLNYADSNLTATATTIIDELTATQNYTVALGDDSIAITVKDSKLYQGDTELSATNDVYTVKVGSKEVKLKYDATNGLQVATNVVDLSTLTADYEAKDGDILTGKPGSYKISIADGATVTLSGVNINVTDIEAAGIACNGSATIILEGTNTVKGAENFAGIQAGNKDTTLTIKGTGSLDATGSRWGAGIGSGFAHKGNSTCGNIVIESGTVTAKGGDFGAGIGSGSANGSDVTSECGDITISGGTVTAKGDNQVAGIGNGQSDDASFSPCGNITITNTVTKVTATKGNSAEGSIRTYNGTVTIGGKTGAKTEDTYTYTPGADISTVTTQTATINSTTITFTTTNDITKYTVGSGTEQTATTTDNKFTFKVDNTNVTATVADGKVNQLSYDTATTTELESKTVTTTYEQTAMLYTFAVNGNDISVSVDSGGKITYNAQAVTDNKITVNSAEVTLTVSDGKITGASYFGEYSTVTEIKQVDVYKVTIDKQEVSCTFDANNQCTVKVGEKNYLVTKTTNGATVTSPAQAVGTEDSRAYLLAVGDENYLISCTFDGSGNVTAVASDDTALLISGTTIKIGDYTINISGTKDNLTTAATLKTTSETVEDVEVKQVFVLSGVKSTDGITIARECW